MLVFEGRTSAGLSLIAVMTLTLAGAAPSGAFASTARPSEDPLFVSTYDGPAHGDDYANFPVVEGTYLFVDGLSTGTGGNFDYATVAYNMSTGAQLWVARYDGPGHGDDVAQPMALSPDG